MCVPYLACPCVCVCGCVRVCVIVCVIVCVCARAHVGVFERSQSTAATSNTTAVTGWSCAPRIMPPVALPMS